MTRGAELKTLLICDLVDSTRVVEYLGDARAGELLSRHDAVARELMRECGGREIDKADGFLVLFDRPISAVRFALRYHQALQNLSSQFGVALVTRAGIHLGEVVLRENPPDLVARGAKPLEVEGLAKAVAARLATLAGPRQTLLSRTAFDVARRGAVGDDLGGDAPEWRVHGNYQLQGVEEPLEVCEVGLAGIAPLQAPSDTGKARRAGAAFARIVVLPFADLSAGADAGHVSDGLTDEIITSLSALQALRVISRGTAMQLKGTTKDHRTLGRELGVQYVLDGAVRRANGSLRITAQLARADDGEVLWAHKFTGKLDDLFDIEETIARTVVEQLELRLSPLEEKRLSERPIPNAAAYEYYLRAKHEIYQFTGEALDRALEYLEKGLAILGENIVLRAALGYVYWQYLNAGVRPDPAYLEKARECVERIFALDPNSPYGHRLLGLVEIHAKGDLQETVRHLKLALAADPNDTDTLFWLPLIYGFAGRASSAYPLIERLLEIDPLTPLHRLLPAYLGMLDADFERALPLMAQAYQANRENPAVGQAYGQLLAMSGRTAQAVEVLEQLNREAPGTFFTKLGMCYLHAFRDDREALTAEVTRDVEEGAATDAQYSWSLAQCFALTGNLDRAMHWLSNAVKYGNWNYPLLAERDPLLAGLRSDPRFQQLMGDVRQRWLRFEV